MAITWILVANASLARLYAHLGPQQGLKLVKEIAHPEARMKIADLVTDRAGNLNNGNGTHPPHQPTRNPKHQAVRAFARRLAQELNLGRSRNSFARAILVAPPAFMGMLNEKLDALTAQRVTERLEKDYTKTAEPAMICGRLQSCL